MLRASSPFFRGLPALLLALAPIACGTAGDDSASSPPEREPLVELTGHVPAWLGAARDTGALPPDQPVERVIVLLSRSAQQEQALADLLTAQHTPGSADYHHWLTPDEMGARFGAAPDDIEAVSTWLSSRGLHIDEIPRSRGFLSVSGTAGAVGAALSTELHGFDIAGEHRVSVVSEPRIPASLSGAIRLFAGLSRVAPRPLHRRAPLPLHATPHLTMGGEHFLAPADFATIYNVNAAYGAGITGAGQTIAVVGRSRVDPSDITQFQTTTGQPVKAPTVIIPPTGIDPGQTFDADQDEATLDVTRAGSVAPGATIDLVVSGTPPASMLDGVAIAIQHTVNNALAPIMSVSFGLCESVAGQGLTLFVDSLFMQAAAQGMSIFVSSGDSGVAGCADHALPPPASASANPNYICASGAATCVGGTQLIDTANPGLYWNAVNTPTLGSALSYIPEGAWNEPIDGFGSTQLAATGGGVSGFIAKPSWQTGLGVPADGSRDTPDLAFSGAGHDAYYVCLAYAGGDCATGSFVVFGGTSASTPSMAGIMALVNQKLGAPQGNFNPILYGFANDASASNVFHDVTVATSGVANCTSSPSPCNNSTPGPVGLSGGVVGHQVNAGFDLATGWGSLDVGNLLDAFDASCGPDGAPCDDGNACTKIDTCQGGVCVGGNPVTCVAQDQCHSAGTCDSSTGLCDDPVKPNGTSCSDGNLCTQNDKCQAGICGGTPKSCAAQDQCHLDGNCDPVTGNCNNLLKPNGVACNDGNPCTQLDICQLGVCQGNNPIICVTADQCHDPGVCDSVTGLCNDPVKADGTSCTDSNACTQFDVCKGGTCVAGSAVTCPPPDACHSPGTCDAATGACDNPAKPDGTACPGGTCEGGVCVPPSTTSSSSTGVGGAGGGTSSASSGVGGVGGVGGGTSSASSGVGGSGGGASSSSVGVGGSGGGASSSSVGVGGATSSSSNGVGGAGNGGGTSVGNGGGTSVGNGGTGAGTGVATGAGGFVTTGSGEGGHGSPRSNEEGFEFGGCGCRVGEQSNDPTAPAGAAVMTLAIALASRRRRRAPRA